MPRQIVIKVQDSKRQFKKPVHNNVQGGGGVSFQSNGTTSKTTDRKSPSPVKKSPSPPQSVRPRVPVVQIAASDDEEEEEGPGERPPPLIQLPAEGAIGGGGGSSSDYSDDDMLEPPKNRYARRQSVCAEAYNPDEESDDDEPAVIHPKTDVQRKRLNEAVKHILLFKSLEPEQLNQVLDAMFEVKTAVDDRVIIQGDDGDNFYVIDKGIFDIYVKIDGTDKKVGAYNNKGSFGELALMYNTPRAATIVAASEGVIWALDRVTFRKIVLKAAYKRRMLHEALLAKVPMLEHLNEFERMNVADALESCPFQDGDLIIKQGDEAQNMYFIEKGLCSVKILDDNGVEVEVTKLEEGAFFGELALVTHKPRAASVYAEGRTTVASLDILAFERLLGSCMDVMKRSIGDYEKQLESLGLSNRDLRGK